MFSMLKPTSRSDIGHRIPVEKLSAYFLQSVEMDVAVVSDIYDPISHYMTN